MDEAHMAIAPTFKTNLAVLISFSSSLLGLSATPGRTWNEPDADLELSQFFNRQKVTLQVEGYTNPVDYLVEAGYLARVQNSPLLYQSGFAISEKDLGFLKENFQLSDSFLKKLSEDQMRNILILKKVDELVTRHKRIILFAMNVAHSNLLAICLQARGVFAFSITSNTEKGQRRNLIERFKSDEDVSLVLCNYGILTTGFDAPRTSCALISRPTDSLVLYSQMVGRAIRGTRAGGNETAEIVTVVDSNLPGFDGVANAFFNWEDVW
jgi:superfamily II DNA or RNA helicase